MAQGGGVIKYPPCPACSGEGTLNGMNRPTCCGRGISPEIIRISLILVDEASLSNFGAGMVRNTPEEMLPNPALLDWGLIR